MKTSRPKIKFIPDSDFRNYIGSSQNFIELAEDNTRTVKSSACGLLIQRGTNKSESISLRYLKDSKLYFIKSRRPDKLSDSDLQVILEFLVRDYLVQVIPSREAEALLSVCNETRSLARLDLKTILELTKYVKRYRLRPLNATLSYLFSLDKVVDNSCYGLNRLQLLKFRHSYKKFYKKSAL